jgi:mRNA interferase MazF
MRIDRGDIFWIGPDVIVQDDVFNHSRITTVVVCAITSNLRRADEPGNVSLEPGEGGLDRRSVVVVSQIDAVEKARLGERIGALSSARVDEIIEGLRFVQASFFDR